ASGGSEAPGATLAEQYFRTDRVIRTHHLTFPEVAACAQFTTLLQRALLLHHCHATASINDAWCSAAAPA
ncbi:MAG: hypothetical protein R6X03_12200, partial [Methyloceanibacter sp.]